MSTTRRVAPSPVSHRRLHRLQHESFDYFLHEVNPANGLVLDRTERGAPASIAGTGLALAAYPAAVERHFMTRRDAVRRSLATLRFFARAPHGPTPDCSGYHGFFYHFLDPTTGRRTQECELSTIDSALLFAGALTAATYFDGDGADERELRELAEHLYRRADWRWARNGGTTISHGWTPERGFLPYRWEGYCEALILYVLALGSPTRPVPAEAYTAWTSTYQWRTVYEHEYLHAGPLFTHQLSHVWIDFRGIADAYMRARHIDYFENSRRATYVHREYAIRNPRRLAAYDETCWGISASDGPGPAVRRIRGTTRRFYGYVARGVPYGPDDGTLSPWAAVASLPFAPEIVLPVLQRFDELRVRGRSPYGFAATFNPTFPTRRGPWIAQHHVALNQGPVVLMVENYRSGLIWRLMRSCSHITRGLRRAGFTGGWLSNTRGP